ncbi:hypothetical protein L7F22_007746 [Adiantum nelumboides]|nr:hypothetical protein [Adiantum nelumboides]
MLFAGPGYLQVPTLPMFFWDLKREELFIPRQSGVGIDTCLLIYLALRNVPQFQEKGLFVKNLLEQPIAFVISESVYVELLDVLLRESKPVPGIIPRSSLIKPRWVAYFVKEVANSGLRAFRSPVMKRWEKNAWKLQPDSLFKKLKNCDNYLSSEDMKFNRSLRLELVKELLKILRDFTFTQSEPGRGAYKNLFSLVSSTYVQPPDARIMLESVGPTVHLFFSEDLQHGQLFRCIRSKVTRGLLVWHILTHQVKYY